MCLVNETLLALHIVKKDHSVIRLDIRHRLYYTTYRETTYQMGLLP